MNWKINFEFPVREENKDKKEEMVVAYSDCQIAADTIEDALKLANDLLPQVCQDYVITGVAVILEA